MQSTRNLTKGIPLLALCLSVIFSAGCSSKKKPAAVLREADFTALLVEIYTSEAKLGPLRLTRDFAQKIYEPFEKQLLEKYHVTTAQLKDTYRYYLNHPAEFDKIYEVVMDTLR